jgi:quercetin dioxygenase-like cupin family protein
MTERRNLRIDADRVVRSASDGVLTEKALRPGDAREIVFGRWVIDADVSLPAHVHTADTIAYCVSGSCAFQIGDQLDERFEIGPGDYAYIPAGTVHTEETGANGVELIFARDRQGGETSQHDAR